MRLNSGTKLGSYEISAALGAGGMGEVYRARDTRLGRVVALKVLRPDLASDGDSRARFEREARAVASLNHPHICALYDVGRDGDVDFLVLEHLEGETLADRIARGALPLEDALRIAIEFAGALAGAHRCGVIHRDLKPTNVMLTRHGAKLLDFGLARLRRGGDGFHAGDRSGESSQAKEQPLTAEATVIGTLPYMAPEQVEGKPVDARSDVFSAGVVLYEMVAGRRPFRADSAAGLVADILHSEPEPLSRARPDVPPALENVVRHCLAKDPDDRWQSARDLELELRWIRESLARADLAPRGRTARIARLGWLAASAAGIAALALGALLLLDRRARPTQEVIRFTLEVPEGTTIEEGYWSHPRVSPDGRSVAFTASGASGRGLWIRPLDGLSARLLPGTEGATAPFWSPDSRSVAFFAGSKLKAVPASGGVPQSLCDVAAVAVCGSWSRDGQIVFAVLEAPGQDGLYSVAASGGEPARLNPRERRGAIEHAFYPHFLPDGRFLFFGWLGEGDSDGGLYLASLDSEEVERLQSGRLASRVEYAPPGYLLGAAENSLLAYGFDADRALLTGDSTAVAEDVSVFVSGARFSVSDTGVLVYQPIPAASAQLSWLDREGRVLGSVGDAGAHDDLCISPDGQRAAVAIGDPRAGSSDLWILPLTEDAPLRLTSDAGDEISPVWSPDGNEIAYAWSRDGAPHVFRLRVGAPEPELLVPHNGHVQWVCDWSPDGRTIVYIDRDPVTLPDLWMVALDGDRKAVPWLQTRFSEVDAQFSPDGRWIAYASDDTGRFEVYVQPFPGPGEKRRISVGGGRMPRWSLDGKEIVYVDREAEPGIVAVAVEGSAAEPAASARALFRLGSRVRSFDVTKDGQRFLVNCDLDASSRTLVHVVVNWTAAIGR
jgi:eukaryotic-like serine/threonine-protein kinase